MPPDQACAVVRNLDWLTEAFHLSRAERKVLLWTYVVNCLLHPFVEGVMSEIQFCNQGQAHAALSLLMDEPESEVAKCFAAPSRLRGMRFIDSHPWRYPLTLDGFFQGTENLTDVLEVVHYRLGDALCAAMCGAGHNIRLLLRSSGFFVSNCGCLYGRCSQRYMKEIKSPGWRWLEKMNCSGRIN